MIGANIGQGKDALLTLNATASPPPPVAAAAGAPPPPPPGEGARSTPTHTHTHTHTHTFLENNNIESCLNKLVRHSPPTGPAAHDDHICLQCPRGALGGAGHEFPYGGVVCFVECGVILEGEDERT